MSKAIIIGGGVIGLFSAYYLHKSGWEVDILEKGDLADNCSFGNAGMVTPSHFVPLASPGMVEQGIRWMFNSKSPFYVKPSLNGDLISWGLKFVKSATKKHVERSAKGLADISMLSKALFMDFEKDTAIDFGLTDKGILMLFKSAKIEEEERHLVEKAATLGLDAEYLSPAEAAKLQPEIELDILGAVHYRCDAHMYPNKLMRGLVKYLETEGVRIHRNSEVVKINHEGAKITSVQTKDKTFTADKYLIAGGSWSPDIAKLTGLNLSLMPGKGYSFMVDNPVQRITIPAILCEARVAVTPMNGSIRFGGTMEVGKINKEVNMNRVKGIVESVPKYFPDFKLPLPEQKQVWFGFRPVSPDGLPYIGMSGKYSNLAIATGHAMIGLSLAPATGKVIADTFNEIKPEVELDLYAPGRFR
jgi:D-amino-acid dehydrogenase